MMNPMNKRIDDSEVPHNLPHDNEPSNRNNDDVSFKISKKTLKTGIKILVIIIIVVLAMPRIINNVKSTVNVAGDGASKFDTYFPSLSGTGSAIGSFIFGEIKNVSRFVADNLASMAELFYTRRIPDVDISDSGIEETAKPVKLVIDKIGVNTPVMNPISTEVTALDESLKYGVARYPKSALLGENDNIYIFGHSTSYQVVRNQAYKALNDLEKLEAGDVIKVISENKEYLYKVTSVRTERDSNAVVKFNTGKRTLTISTCNTLGAKEDRHIVEADFVTSYAIAGIISDDSNDDDQIVVVDNSNNNSNNSNTGGSTAVNPGQTTTQVIPIQTGSTIRVSDPYGQADLTAEITEVGVINASNEFVASSTPSAGSKIAFKFIISNIGTKTAENWRFNVVLPTDPIYIYSGNTQQALRPGERIEYAMGFDRAKAGTDMAIIVNVNPSGSTNEKTRDNNIAKKLITIIAK